MTIYAVGDIHGHLDQLRSAYDRILADKAREGTGAAEVVFIGDYADRGKDVPGVLDMLISCIEDGEPVVCLAGNHDRMMLGFLDPSFPQDALSGGTDWLRPEIGGRHTLKGYGLNQLPWGLKSAARRKVLSVIPDRHVDFLRGLNLYHEAPGLFFAHAGIHPDRPLNDQFAEDLLWIRGVFLHDARDHGALIVHGHTPVQEVDHAGNRVNIDTGAGFGRPLSAVAIEDGEVFLLTDSGRQQVIPR